jgi:hypothetical protein
MRAPTDPGVRLLRLVLFGWALLGAAAMLLALRYGALPDTVPLYRPPWSDAPTVGPRTPLTVGRLVTMGLGQVGAATVMAAATWRAEGWRRLWTWAVVVAGAKTLFECSGLAFPGVDGTALALTVLVVGAFGVAAIAERRRGALGPAPALGWRLAAGLVLSLALWAVSAVAPLLA